MTTLPDLLNHIEPSEVAPSHDASRENLPIDYEWPESGPTGTGTGIGNGIDDPKGKRKARVGPFGAKVMAAMTGAMTTSLLMTPFDVLKTRLQTVQPQPRLPYTPPPPECCQTSVITPSKPSLPIPSTANPLTCFSSASTSSASSSSASTLPRSSSLLQSRSISAIPATAPSGCINPSKWAGIWGEALTLDQALSRGVVGMSGGGATLVLPETGTGIGSLGNLGRGAERGIESVVGGFWDEVAAVRREGGVRGLWKGVGTTLTMSIPSAAIYMLGYEHLLTNISPFFTGSSDPAHNASSLNRPQGSGQAAPFTFAPLVAGSMARTFSATIISPLEMFRTRLQALPTVERGNPTYRTTAKELSHLVSTTGPKILWRGLGPTLWRDVPFSGLYWAGFELLKPIISPHLSPITTSFWSGAISGTVAAVFTQPFDVLKTRRQVFTPHPDCATEAVKHPASTIPLLMHVVRTEGWGALFAGLVPRCGKVAPACGLMIACYEGVGRYLGGEE